MDTLRQLVCLSLGDASVQSPFLFAVIGLRLPCRHRQRFAKASVCMCKAANGRRCMAMATGAAPQTPIGWITLAGS